MTGPVYLSARLLLHSLLSPSPFPFIFFLGADLTARSSGCGKHTPAATGRRRPGDAPAGRRRTGDAAAGAVGGEARRRSGRFSFFIFFSCFLFYFLLVKYTCGTHVWVLLQQRTHVPLHQDGLRAGQSGRLKSITMIIIIF